MTVASFSINWLSPATALTLFSYIADFSFRISRTSRLFAVDYLPRLCGSLDHARVLHFRGGVRRHEPVGLRNVARFDREAVMGTLRLYLDFINLFLMLLRLLGYQSR